MESDEQFGFKPPKSPKKFPRMLYNPDNSAAVYTALCILQSMKTQLCLEAMFEYMDVYMTLVERHNPTLRDAVLMAISEVGIEKMYKEAVE